MKIPPKSDLQGLGQTAEEERSRARQTAVISFGHATVMALGGVLALLIAHFFGKSARTDGFFAAFGVYSVALTFGLTFRLTAVPRLIDNSRPSSADRLLAAVVLMALVVGVPMLLLADPVGNVLVKHDPGNVAAESLRALWPAVFGQLLLGYLAALLLVRGLYGVIGVGYAASGIMSIAVFLALEGALGVQAVSFALGLTSVSLAVLFLLALARSGWRPDPHLFLRIGEALREAGRLLFASSSFVAANLGYVICLAVVSREGTGEATLYAYAYFPALVLVATTAVSAAMVTTPTLLAQPSSRGLIEASTISTYQFTVALIAPVFAFALLVGEPVMRFVLGEDFSGHDAERLVITLVCLSGWVLASAAGVYAVLALLTRDRGGALAAIAVLHVAVLTVLALAGRELAGIQGVALAQSSAMLAATAAQLRLAFGPAWTGPIGRLSSATLKGAFAASAAFAPSVAIMAVFDHSLAATMVGVALAAALMLMVSRAAWPGETAALVSVLSRR